MDDALAAYDVLLHTEGVDPDNSNLIGSSFGCYIASLLTKERSVRSLTFRAPADYPDEGFNDARIQTADQPGPMEWRSRVRPFTDTESLRRLHEFSGDVLCIESEYDDMVPHGTVQSYMNALPDSGRVSHVILRGAPHSLSKSPDAKKEYGRILVERFRPGSVKQEH
ncbi:MAG: hypothetical protein A3I44_04075 [Candidatus Sungbacteria bacterium RIFCSPLOWO2_02_FULL_51_17]|nr:MAG: hypothetical protein A3I44_04075 [Candidatus Sungbacteria bacterium RIFCSPLOWO2_02_FULL_51_17]